MEYIDIDKIMIPYRFEVSIKNETFTFEIRYNTIDDFFTVDLYKNDKIIILGEKIIYGKPLFLNAHYKDIPKVDILPYDLSQTTDRVTYENLNNKVFLYLVGD
jgi:hypothetical protein